PDGIAVASVDFTAPAGNTEGKVVARLELTEGSTYPLDQHRPAILLIDSARTEAVNLDYLANLTAESDSEGNLTAVALTIPPGTELPTTLEAVVVLDVFPLHRQDLTEEAR
ncbi:MAG: hypothetical protein U9R25_17115, partial [Chloroflexota bacterium]|nr:hypothetical protein [Chloroflexota bacterium]